MYNLRSLDRAIARPTTPDQVLAMYAAFGLDRDREGINLNVGGAKCYECTRAVNFVVRFLTGARNAAAINEINDNLGADTGLRLGPGNNDNTLSDVLALGGDYIGLLSAINIQRASHNCVFASYGLVSRTRTWGFYQANANIPKFTICPNANTSAVGSRNLQDLNREGFAKFFGGLTAGTLDVLKMGRKGEQDTTWALQVVNFNGRKLLPR